MALSFAPGFERGFLLFAGHFKCPIKRHGRGETAGKVTAQMMHEWVSREGVELRGAGLDESPHCYKRLPEVLEQHADSILILHTLRPIGVAMAGANEFDPYRD